MTPFFIVVFSVFSLIVTSQFFLLRLILPQGLSKTARTTLSFALTLGMNLIPFLYLRSEGFLDERPWWHRELIIFPYTMVLVSSAISSVLLPVIWLAGSIRYSLRPRFNPGKRQFLSSSARIVAGSCLAVSAHGIYQENKTLELSRLTLSYGRLHPDLRGFRLVHITDIHAGPLISFDAIAEMVVRANELKPDLIVLTGDYVNHNPEYIDGCLQRLDELRAPAGVFGVYGNHDYYTGIAAMREGFSKTQIAMLSDSRQHANGLDGILNIIGVEDPMRGWLTEASFSNPEHLSRLVASDRFNLLLSHRPGIFRLCKGWNVALTLAGHTHGGQIILPGVGGRGLSLAGLFLAYTHGLYESEEIPEVRMYVSRGIGTIVAPVRLFCKPELVEVTLTEA